MNNEEQTLDALTDQPVEVTIGGKQYKARRATLYDVGVMNRKRKELTDAGDTANLDVDTAIFVLYELLKDADPTFPYASAEEFTKHIPFSAVKDVTTAFETVGFNSPQSQKEEKVIGE